MEMKTKEVKSRLEEVEKEVENGMERAKEEVKKEVKNEMKQIEENSVNVVVYGILGPKEEDRNKRMKENQEKLEELVKEIGVIVEGGDGKTVSSWTMDCRFRKAKDRELIYKNARKLARSDQWKKVFIAPDMTKKQRAEDKRQEMERKSDAEK